MTRIGIAIDDRKDFDTVNIYLLRKEPECDRFRISRKDLKGRILKEGENYRTDGGISTDIIWEMENAIQFMQEHSRN